jgi:predicted transcriptional regulator
MANVQVRLPEDLEASVDALAERLHGNRSDAIRVALAEGVQVIRERQAFDAYVAGRCSLERAAHDAGIPLHAMASRAAAAGIPYLRYSPAEAGEDVEALD